MTVADQVYDALGDVEGLNVIVTDVVGECVGLDVAEVVCVPERDCVCVALCDVDAVADHVYESIADVLGLAVVVPLTLTDSDSLEDPDADLE